MVQNRTANRTQLGRFILHVERRTGEMLLVTPKDPAGRTPNEIGGFEPPFPSTPSLKSLGITTRLSSEAADRAPSRPASYTRGRWPDHWHPLSAVPSPGATQAAWNALCRSVS